MLHFSKLSNIWIRCALEGNLLVGQLHTSFAVCLCILSEQQEKRFEKALILLNFYEHRAFLDSTFTYCCITLFFYFSIDSEQ